MSIRQVKCPKCSSTNVGKIVSLGSIDHIGRRQWIVKCINCSVEFETNLLEKRVRGVHY